MSELTVRRNRGYAPVRYVETGKTEKTSKTASGQRAAGRAATTVSDSLRLLLDRVGQAVSHTQESRRTLQTGEGVLDEVQSSLERLAQLARQAAGGGEPDRAALQAQLERVVQDIDRMIAGAVVDGTPLFLDEEMDLGNAEALLSPALGEPSPGHSAVQELPRWLVLGLGQSVPEPKELLAALGLSETAGVEEVLTVLVETSLDSSPAAGRLATLYLGAFIAGSSDPARAVEGLQRLLEKVAGGVPPDEAIRKLTGDTFAGIEDFQEQFTAGAAPGLERFLTELLSEEGELSTSASLMALLACVQDAEMGVILRILNAMLDSVDLMDLLSGVSTEGAQAAPVTTLSLGNVQVIGRDLSGVSLDESTGMLTIGGGADVTVCGVGGGPQAIRITGEGTVTLHRVEVSALTVASDAAHLHGRGESTLAEVTLDRGAQLTLDGGLLKIGTLRGDRSNLLHLAGGAVSVGEGQGTLPVPVVLEGPASLAVRAASVRTPEGKALEPFDLVWKTLLPNWSGITALALDGKQTRLDLQSPDPARLWLYRGEASHGFPIYTLEVRRRDVFGRPQSRYAYLHWNPSAGTFREINMYPNPFSVTGGEPERDWVYEEASRTLRILSNQVTAVSGGMGTDANEMPFCGRLALADSIGALELTLGGVVCRVPSGRAFDLGAENDVTLLLQSGSRNRFQSGPGCAGISLGEGTSLSIACARGSGSRSPEGSLHASGGEGGAGIGRDSGALQDRDSRIVIRGGVITAEGNGGGAGIGAGKHADMGEITVLGGTVTSTGEEGGGAGIGGALGAAAGDITIRGGQISAFAVRHAAAIGAGVQGKCGNISIAGTARIVKAVGGDPGADIGACLSGACGEVNVSGAADIGRARLCRHAGVSLSMGEETVTLPQFCLSSRALRLEELDLSTLEGARSAQTTLRADQYWVKQLQRSYGMLYSRLVQSIRGLSNFSYTSAPGILVRDAEAAGTLLEDMRRSILLQSGRTHGRPETEDVRQLLE